MYKKLMILSIAFIQFSCVHKSIEITVDTWDSITISKIHESFSIDTSKYNCEEYPELVINGISIKSFDFHVRQLMKNRKYLVEILQRDDEFIRIEEVFVVEFYGNTYFAPNSNSYIIISRNYNKGFESLNGDSTFTVSPQYEKADNSKFAYFHNSIRDNNALNLKGMQILTRIYIENGSTKYEVQGIQLW